MKQQVQAPWMETRHLNWRWTFFGTRWKYFLKEQVEGNVYIAFMHVYMWVEGYFFENKEMLAGICND